MTDVELLGQWVDRVLDREEDGLLRDQVERVLAAVEALADRDGQVPGGETRAVLERICGRLAELAAVLEGSRL